MRSKLRDAPFSSRQVKRRHLVNLSTCADDHLYSIFSPLETSNTEEILKLFHSSFFIIPSMLPLWILALEYFKQQRWLLFVFLTAILQISPCSHLTLPFSLQHSSKWPIYYVQQWLIDWRVRGKRALGFQNWTLSETLQISHAVLFTWVKQCSACFFPEVCFLFEILCMRKNTFF